MLRNLVKETATNPGSGTSINLGGAPSGYVSFVSAFGSGGAAWYAITDGVQTEIQSGTVTAGSPNTLSRGTPVWTSAGGSTRLSFTGAVTIYCVQPADRTLYADASSVWQAQARRIAGMADGTAQTDAPTLQQLTWRRLSTSNFSSTTALATFTLPSTSRKFRVDYLVVASVAGAVFAQLSLDGTTFRAGASDYGYVASSSRIASVVNFGGLLSYIPVSDTANAAGQMIGGAFEFDATTNYGTADAVALTSGAVAGRWSGGFYPGFAGASLAIRIGIVGGSMNSGIVALSGNF
jgi:hypothetical protein